VRRRLALPNTLDETLFETAHHDPATTDTALHGSRSTKGGNAPGWCRSSFLGHPWREILAWR
jgi:hypothetical protein